MTKEKMPSAMPNILATCGFTFGLKKTSGHKETAKYARNAPIRKKTGHAGSNFKLSGSAESASEIGPNIQPAKTKSPPIIVKIPDNQTGRRFRSQK
jgi:hypothetical protein